MNLPDTFWARVAQAGDCWEWTAGKTAGGYGRFWIDQRDQYAHRLSYEALVAEIPDGLVIDHRCKNRACVNPAHLEPVTLAVNSARNTWAEQGSCVNGHPYSDTNTYQWRGSRRCRACVRANVARHRERRRALTTA